MNEKINLCDKEPKLFDDEELKNQELPKKDEVMKKNKTRIRNSFVPPSKDEIVEVIKAFNEEHKVQISLVLADKFIAYYEKENKRWVMSNDKPLKDWKRALKVTWLFRELEKIKLNEQKSSWIYNEEAKKERLRRETMSKDEIELENMQRVYNENLKKGIAIEHLSASIEKLKTRIAKDKEQKELMLKKTNKLLTLKDDEYIEAEVLDERAMNE